MVCLTMDEGGIKSDVDSRVAVARKIIKRAESLGIKRDDLVIDCLVMTASTDSKAGGLTPLN